MKRKTLIVLLVLLLVGILAFTVFACNDNKKPNNPGTDTPGGDGPGPDDDDPPEEETYDIVEALPKLVTGLDKVAATVADIDEGKAAYLGADIGLNFGVTAEGLDVAADLVLSLKVSVDEDTAANNWALIGLKSDKKDVAQLYIRAEAADKEVIYIKEALTGSNNWKVLSVLDVSEKPDLEGLFTGSNYGLIGKLFSLVTGLTAEDSTFPIDFDAASPIGGLEIMEGSSINQLLGTVKLLGKVVDGALHAEAFDNGNRYVATLNRAGIGDLIGGLTGTFDLGDLLTTLEDLNPVLRLVLGMEVKEGKFNVLKYDDPDDAPVLDIEFSVDPDTAALTDLSIDFANGDIEGMGIKLGLALSNIVLSDESKAPDTETAGAEALGINLGLEAKLPAWKEAATIAVSVDPKAVIGWNAKDGSIEIDLSAVQGHATFNDALIAEYTDNKGQKGFAITLKPVYDFIAKDQTGDLRDQVYFIPCDLAAIVTAALNPTNDAGTETIQNAAFAEQIDLSGTLGTLVETIQAMIAAPTFDIASIGNRTRTAGIAEAERDIMLLADIQYLIKTGIEWILLPCQHHPCKDYRTAARYDIRMPCSSLDALCSASVYAAVDCHEVNTVLRVHPHNIQPFLGGNLLQCLVVINNGVVDRHCPDDRRALRRKPSAEHLRISKGAEVHDRLRPHIHRVLYLLHLNVQILAVPGGAQIHVDLRL